MTGLLVALAAASAVTAPPAAGLPAAGLPETVSVRVLGKLHPTAVEVSDGARVVRAAVASGRLLVDGVAAPGPVELPRGRWRIASPGAPPRSYDASVALAADGREVAVLLRMDLEDHVAAVVAAESGPDTPREALRALAVVVRSFAASARGRHTDADLCDLAHCQVMAGRGTGRHGAAAREAARSTAGRVLRLASGRMAEAPVHAACGGHTADPREVFGGEGTGAAAVPDPECPVEEWRVVVPAEVLARALRRTLTPGHGKGDAGAAPDALRLQRGAGGRVVRVDDGRSSLGGEAFARALDRELGHGRVRSASFQIVSRGGDLELRGRGNGHGVGLCQAGAALRASRGEDHAAILARYFPLVRIDPGPAVSAAGAGPTAPPWAPLNRTSSR